MATGNQLPPHIQKFLDARFRSRQIAQAKRKAVNDLISIHREEFEGLVGGRTRGRKSRLYAEAISFLHSEGIEKFMLRKEALRESVVSELYPVWVRKCFTENPSISIDLVASSFQNALITLNKEE